MKVVGFVFLFCFSISHSNGEVSEVPNFLSGLDQQKTMEFYAIESGLNLSKADILRKKAEWAADLPIDNRVRRDDFR